MVDVQRRQLLTLGATVLGAKFLTACRSAADASTRSSTVARNATLNLNGWATGGPAAMTAKASYPNPFTSDQKGATCALTGELVEGPCYDSASEELQDISYGYSGLPMRMQLRVLDGNCKPIAGAVVDVWHVSPVGKYSGNDAAHEAIAFCTENDADFTSHLYFRGKQKSDANGVVTFDSCFPGWYSGRAIHVHTTISVNGQAYLTTQLCFDDALNEAIVSSQPLYDARGLPDTHNADDGVFNADDYKAHLFKTERMIDGAMLASKTIILGSIPKHSNGPRFHGNQGAAGFAPNGPGSSGM